MAGILPSNTINTSLNSSTPNNIFTNANSLGSNTFNPAAFLSSLNLGTQSPAYNINTTGNLVTGTPGNTAYNANGLNTGSNNSLAQYLSGVNLGNTGTVQGNFPSIQSIVNPTTNSTASTNLDPTTQSLAGSIQNTNTPYLSNVDFSNLNAWGAQGLLTQIQPLMNQLTQTYGTPGTQDANGNYTGQGGSGLLGSMAATIPQLQTAYGNYNNYLNTTGPTQLQNIANQQMNQNLANQQTGINSINTQSGQLQQQYNQQMQAADTGTQASSAQSSGAAGTPFQAIEQAAADQPYLVQLKNLNANTTMAIAQLVANTNSSNTNIETATEGQIQQMNEQAYAIAPQEIQNIAQANQNIAQTQLAMTNGQISAWQGIYQQGLNLAAQQDNMQLAQNKINEEAYSSAASTKATNLNALVNAYSALNPNMQTIEQGGKTYLYNPQTGAIGTEITPGGISGGLSQLLNGSSTFTNAPGNQSGNSLASLLQAAGY